MVGQVGHFVGTIINIMVRIVRNVGGIIGLHVALDAFTEAAEQRLFESQQIHASQEGSYEDVSA